MVKIVNQVNRETTSVDYQTGGIKKIRISNNLSSIDVAGQIGDNSMLSSLRIVRLGSQVKRLLPGCFMNCENLAEVEVPEECQYIEESAFMNCATMSKINCLQGNGQILKKIGTRGFAKCDGLQDVTLKLNGNPAELYEILGNECFASCQNLQSVKFTGSAYVSKRMFQDCNSLTSIQLANSQGYMYPEGFANIHSIESITIPNKTWIINDGTFAGCESLSSVIFEDGDTLETSSNIEMFGNGIFDGCESLTEITIPKSITSFSQLGNEMLAGSSISCVRFSGIPRDYFGQYEVQKKLTYTTGKWYIGKDKKSCSTALKIAKYAHSNRIPVVIQLSRNESILSTEMKVKKKKKIVPYADSNWANAVNGFQLNENYFFIKAWYDTYYTQGLYDWIQARCNNELSIDGEAGYPYIIPMWNKKEGFKYEIYENPYRNTKLNTSKRFNDTLDKMFSGYTPPTTQIHTITENSKVSILGLPTSCLYYASDGSYRVVNSDGTIKYSAEMLVDEFSKVNFKTGTWYYNAKELKQFADRWHIPVVIEYSSKGCTPCEYWARNSFNDSAFQSWVKNQKFLFCRVEKKSASESWTDPAKYPQLNFVEYEWVKAQENKIPYPPVFCWYWNKESGEIVKDVSSYHFNQGVGSEPPWTNEQFYQMTTDKFSGYRESSDLAHGLSCPEISVEWDSDKKQYPKVRVYKNQYVRDLPPKLYENCKEYDIEYLLSSEENGYLFQLSSDWENGNSPYDAYNELTSITGEEERNSKKREYLSNFIVNNVYKGEIDPNGVFFVCERKDAIEKYYGTVTIKNGVTLSAPQIGNEITAIGIDGTYQVFLAKNAYRYDKESLILRIKDGKIEYLYRGQNYVDDEEDYIQTGYSTGEFVHFSGSQNGDGLSSLIDQAEAKSIAVVIAVHVQNEQAQAINILNQMFDYVSNSGIYWIDLEIGNVSEFNDDGTAANQFRKFTNREYIGKWDESEGSMSTTPFMCMYRGCSTCGVGQPAVYVRRVKSMGYDANQLTSWVELHKNAEEQPPNQQ